MEQFIEQLISTGPVGIVCAAVVYLVIAVQRNNTKKSRDDDREKLNTRIALLEDKVAEIDRLDLDARLAAIETSLKYIQMLLENRQSKQ